VRTACKILAIVLMLCLAPVVWWKGLESTWIVWLLLGVGAAQLVAGSSGFMRLQAMVTIALACLIAIASHQLTLYYPVLINGMLLVLWFFSWLNPPTIIERLAPKRDVEQSHKRDYMRRLTLTWCGVFAFNLVVSLITTQLDDLTPWLIWNGLGAYLLVGGFAVGEYVFRKWFLKDTMNDARI
jgi:uncharacterized membrane protein